MEIWKLAVLAYEGMRVLSGFIAGAGAVAGAMVVPVAPAPVDVAPSCFFQESAHEGPAFCPNDITAFTLLEPDEHWMVRR